MYNFRNLLRFFSNSLLILCDYFLKHAQFYASKKRKPLSPVLKPGKKINNNEVEGRSPSAKGTLDNYLVTSQDDNNTRKTLHTESDLLGRQDPVRRNLSSEINSSLKDESERAPLPSQSQTLEAFEAVQKGKSEALSEVGNAEVGLAKGNSAALLQGVENSELKKFATDFLSLYCRYCTLSVTYAGSMFLFCFFFFLILVLAKQYCLIGDFLVKWLLHPLLFLFSDLQSNVNLPSELNVNDHKRQASPSLPHISKKKHCSRKQSHSGCDENNSEETQSGVLSRTGVSLLALFDRCCNFWYSYL